MSDPAPKRKRPPTFQHFPTQRAKKLKKTWVETAKIRSKWKAEKRKLAGGSKPIHDNEESVHEDSGDDGNTDADKGAESSKGSHSDSERSSEEIESPESPNVVQAPNQHQSMHPSRIQIKPKRGSHLEPPASKQKGKEDEQQLSVRELTRLAYSSSTLHTYKSDPLHRRNGDRSSRGNDGGRGRGDGRGRGRGRGGSRGQPDMKLRMNAMLAKIKQDLGS